MADQCAHCHGPATARATFAAALPLGRPFSLLWPRLCDGCGDPMQAGDLGRYDADHDIVCDHCAELVRLHLAGRPR